MKKYEIIIGSPVDYEELVAYIIIEGKHIALINQDEGTDKLKIEFFEEPKVQSLDYDTFTQALVAAKKALLNY